MGKADAVPTADVSHSSLLSAVATFLAKAVVTWIA